MSTPIPIDSASIDPANDDVYLTDFALVKRLLQEECEDIIAQLSKSRGLKGMSRTSTLRFKQRPQSIRALRAAAAGWLSPAGQLQVATALEVLEALEARLDELRLAAAEAALGLNNLNLKRAKDLVAQGIQAQAELDPPEQLV